MAENEHDDLAWQFSEEISSFVFVIYPQILIICPNLYSFWAEGEREVKAVVWIMLQVVVIMIISLRELWCGVTLASGSTAIVMARK